MSTKYEVRFELTWQELVALAAATTLEPVVVAPIVVAPIVANGAAPAEKPRRQSKPARETDIGKLVLGLMASRPDDPGPLHYKDLAAELVRRGYSATTASPALSKLAEQGDVIRSGRRGYYKLAAAPGETTLL